MDNSGKQVLGLTLLLLVFTPNATSTDASVCVGISAAITREDHSYYFFSGNQYTYYNYIRQTSGDSTVHPITDFAGMDQGDDVTAGYLEPGTDDEARLFSGSDVFRVDLKQKKVLEKTTVSAMFSESEMSKLQDGIQAAATFGRDRFFFSGCLVLKTDLEGNMEDFDLRDYSIPCHVDSAFSYPQKNSDNLFITKGGSAYGWFLGTDSLSYIGYHMYCIADHFQNIAFDLCHCQDV